MILPCPVCREERHAPATDWLAHGAYHRCSICGVEFVEPKPPAEVYPDFSDYGETLLSRATEPYFMSDREQPSEIHARRWARRHISAGAPILELFAECGRFSWLIRSDGFAVRTADPLPAHVALLRRHGFESVVGQLDAVPDDWPAPAAVFILESIVRVQDPRRLIEGIRVRWPTAMLYVTAPSTRRSIKLPGSTSRGYLPPDFITRWDAPALIGLLRTAGYSAEGGVISPMAVRRLPATRWKRRLFNLGWTLPLRLNGEYCFSEWAASLPSSRTTP